MTTKTRTSPSTPTAAEVRERLIQPLDDAAAVREAIVRAAPLRERCEDQQRRDYHYRSLSDPNLRIHIERAVSREEVLAAAEAAPTPGALAIAERQAIEAERSVEQARQSERDSREQLFRLFMQSRLPDAFAKVQAAVEALGEIGELEFTRHEAGAAGAFYNPISLPQLSGWLEMATDEAKRLGYITDSD